MCKPFGTDLWDQTDQGRSEDSKCAGPLAQGVPGTTQMKDHVGKSQRWWVILIYKHLQDNNDRHGRPKYSLTLDTNFYKDISFCFYSGFIQNKWHCGLVCWGYLGSSLLQLGNSEILVGLTSNEVKKKKQNLTISKNHRSYKSLGEFLLKNLYEATKKRCEPRGYVLSLTTPSRQRRSSRQARVTRVWGPAGLSRRKGMLLSPGPNNAILKPSPEQQDMRRTGRVRSPFTHSTPCAEKTHNSQPRTIKMSTLSQVWEVRG